ncbi:MAG TPA: hypothetical protein VFF52_24660 [Isosphaeraceae bacterium]|nr:hypothetical protein [Isosphaeraceae bacterium]
MMIGMRLARTWSVSLASAGVLALIGCGQDDGIGTRYPVSGTITYKAEPVKKGTITFTPQEQGGRAASGDISEGAYRLTTQSPGDGALPGKYRVSIIAKEPDEGALAKTKGRPNQADVVKSYLRAKDMIPKKYQLADTSGLTAEVKGQSNDLSFELKD